MVSDARDARKQVHATQRFGQHDRRIRFEGYGQPAVCVEMYPAGVAETADACGRVVGRRVHSSRMPTGAHPGRACVRTGGPVALSVLMTARSGGPETRARSLRPPEGWGPPGEHGSPGVWRPAEAWIVARARKARSWPASPGAGGGRQFLIQEPEKSSRPLQHLPRQAPDRHQCPGDAREHHRPAVQGGPVCVRAGA